MLTLQMHLKMYWRPLTVFAQKMKQLITVVGCGGDRDKTKRPKMGHIAQVK